MYACTRFVHLSSICVFSSLHSTQGIRNNGFREGLPITKTTNSNNIIINNSNNNIINNNSNNNKWTYSPLLSKATHTWVIAASFVKPPTQNWGSSWHWPWWHWPWWRWTNATDWCQWWRAGDRGHACHSFLNIDRLTIGHPQGYWQRQ